MASDSAAAPLDYLFLREVYSMNLKGVDLATISACETARGKFVRGDGVQAFSQARSWQQALRRRFTSLWRVEDLATGRFMKQFYYFLAQGQPEIQRTALREAAVSAFQLGMERATVIGRHSFFMAMAGIPASA